MRLFQLALSLLEEGLLCGFQLNSAGLPSLRLGLVLFGLLQLALQGFHGGRFRRGQLFAQHRRGLAWGRPGGRLQSLVHVPCLRGRPLKQPGPEQLLLLSFNGLCRSSAVSDGRIHPQSQVVCQRFRVQQVSVDQHPGPRVLPPLPQGLALKAEPGAQAHACRPHAAPRRAVQPHDARMAVCQRRAARAQQRLRGHPLRHAGARPSLHPRWRGLRGGQAADDQERLVGCRKWVVHGPVSMGLCVAEGSVDQLCPAARCEDRCDLWDLPAQAPHTITRRPSCAASRCQMRASHGTSGRRSNSTRCAWSAPTCRA